VQRNQNAEIRCDHPRRALFGPRGARRKRELAWIANRGWPWASFQGSNERERDLLGRRAAVSTLERYQHRHIICTGYINIMLSRFLVKCSPPKETVASATAETGYRWRRRRRTSGYYSGNLQQSSSSRLKAALLSSMINFFYVKSNNILSPPI